MEKEDTKLIMCALGVLLLAVYLLQEDKEAAEEILKMAESVKKRAEELAK